MSLGFNSAFCTGLLILVVTACSRNEEYITPRNKRVAAENHSIPGKIVTDNFARPSYFVSGDSGSRSSCDSGWIGGQPVLYVGNPTIEPYLESIDFTFCKMSRRYYQ